MTTNLLPTDSSPNPAELERDRKMEVLLEELVASPRSGELPEGFAERVLASRPFAPWEVARPSVWKVPAAVGLGLLAGSLGLGLTPLWSLGPATAVTVWAELVAVAFGRPVATLVASFPLLAEGTGQAARAVSPGFVALVGGGALVAAASLAAALGRVRRPGTSLARRPG